MDNVSSTPSAVLAIRSGAFMGRRLKGLMQISQNRALAVGRNTGPLRWNSVPKVLLVSDPGRPIGWSMPTVLL